ncbi:MAG TPA: hypothetical protein VFM96_00340 [Gaiellaceae bacterium]|nr:hypothetical protein [Gaiellaceae bacterium]
MLHRALGEWVWRAGDGSAYVGQPTGSGSLVLAASQDINLLAGHVRLMSGDGGFSLVHPPSASAATINAYYVGTPTRTPVAIGNGVGDVTSLVVAGSSGQSSDLQQWTSSGQTVAAIDAAGHLRLGGVTLEPQIIGGRVYLYAMTQAGRQLLAVGVPTR